MRHRIRRTLYSSLLGAVLASGVLAGTGSLIAGLSLFRGYLERSVAASTSEAVRRVRAFDVSLSAALLRGREAGARALAGLSVTYPDRAHAAGATRAELRAQADAMGVDDIYLVGRDGRVFATSFQPDQGLDLFSFSAEFKTYLSEMFGTGRRFDQEVSGSTQTGNVNIYQYFGTASGDLIIEVSSRLRRLVAEIYPGLTYEGFLALFFTNESPGADESPVAVEDYVMVGSGESLVKENVQHPSIAAQVKNGRLEGNLSWLEGNSRMLLVPFDEKVFWTTGKASAILLRIDESYYSSFALISAALTLAAIAVATLLSFMSARRIMNVSFTRRLEVLELAMDKVGKGDTVDSLVDSVDDELSSIGKSAALMVDRIRTDADQLRAFARQLEEEISERERREIELEASLDSNRELLREVDHRVKNNLQLLVSLSRLEMDRMTGTEAIEALKRMEARMRNLAMVEDQLTSNPSLERIDMERLLGDLAQEVVLEHPGVFGRIAVGVVASGVRLPADDAVAVLLASRELLDNSLRHAFPGGRHGAVHIELKADTKCFELEVRDDGTGQADTMNEGLGLRIAKAVLEQRGARLVFSGGKGETGITARATSSP